MEYDLSRLSSRSFEQLAQGLSLRVLGPGIVVFGDGPDGGREASFEGEIGYSGARSESWDGYLVVQAKFIQRPKGTSADGAWALKELRQELRKFEEEKGGRKRPDYFVFVTNAVMAPTEGGAKDEAHAVLMDAQSWGLRDFAIWDYDQLRTFLDIDAEVRTTWGWITAGDVLGAMLSQLQGATPDFERTIVNYLEKTLVSDRFVRLEEAGHAAEEPTPLSQVFVDLPLLDEEPNERLFLQELLDRTSEIADQSNTKTGRVVLMGGPGQGKTTVGQFACQIFRAALLDSGPRQASSIEGQETVELVRKACEENGLEFARAPRFPIRVTLTDLAKALAEREMSLISWMAQTLSQRVSEDVPAGLLKEWLAHYPWFLVLDGLDEVPANAGRSSVMNCLNDFWVDAAQLDADIVVLATTRPQGYNNDFNPERYVHLQLAELPEERALDYGRRLAQARYADSDRADAVGERLQRAVDDPTTAHLMRSPLQVAIMTALVDRYGQPPNERWSLFQAYYDVIYQREQERDTDAAPILRQYRPDIDAIHARVGLVLQVLTTHIGHSDPRLNGAQLTQIVDERLADEGHDLEQTTTMASQIQAAAEMRLVFLVGAEADRIGFEIRSLQEFMAAAALVDHRDEVVLERLKTIAPLPSWRNVLLFAAGDCFVSKQYLREPLLALCRSLDVEGDDELLRSVRGGARLALDLLEDRVARRQPKNRRIIAEHALDVLRIAAESLPARLAFCCDDELEDLFQSRLAEDVASANAIRRSGSQVCCAYLSNRGFEWAGDLLAKNLPSSSEDAMALLGSVPRHVAATLDPGVFSACVRQLGARGLRDLVPSLAPLLIERGWPVQHRERALRVELNGFGLTLTLTGINRGAVADGDSDAGGPGPSTAISFYRALDGFNRAPSKASLAEALARIASDTDPETWETLAGVTPWPLQIVLFGVESAEELEKRSAAAATGEFGDEADWLAAERRWEAEGVDALVEARTDSLPFPFEIAGATISGRPNSDPETVWAQLMAITESNADHAMAIARILLWRISLPIAPWDHGLNPTQLVGLTRSCGAGRLFVDVSLFEATTLTEIDLKSLIEAHPDIRFFSHSETDLRPETLASLSRLAAAGSGQAAQRAFARAWACSKCDPVELAVPAAPETPLEAFVAFLAGQHVSARELGRVFASADDLDWTLINEDRPKAYDDWEEFLLGVREALPAGSLRQRDLERLMDEVLSKRANPFADRAIWSKLELFEPHPLDLIETE